MEAAQKELVCKVIASAYKKAPKNFQGKNPLMEIFIRRMERFLGGRGPNDALNVIPGGEGAILSNCWTNLLWTAHAVSRHKDAESAKHYLMIMGYGDIANA